MAKEDLQTRVYNYFLSLLHYNRLFSSVHPLPLPPENFYLRLSVQNFELLRKVKSLIPIRFDPLSRTVHHLSGYGWCLLLLIPYSRLIKLEFLQETWGHRQYSSGCPNFYPVGDVRPTFDNNSFQYEKVSPNLRRGCFLNFIK